MDFAEDYLLTLLAAHVFCTFFMTGLCVFVQLVHYPLFRHINPADFPKYERKNFATILITLPVMAVEYISGTILLFYKHDYFWLVNGAILILIALSTFLLQVPTHLKLRNESSEKLISKLIRTNWIRTIGWTIRSGMMIYVLVTFLLFG